MRARSHGQAATRRSRSATACSSIRSSVDVVYDGVGGDLSIESLRCVRFGARYLIVGWAATPFVAKGKGQRGAPNANQLPTNLIMMKGLDVLGCPTAISTVHDPASRAPRLAQVMAWAATGQIRPLVSRRYALEDFAIAMRAKWHGEAVGGCVVQPRAGVDRNCAVRTGNLRAG
jgi:NADPH2:quinone reductase